MDADTQEVMTVGKISLNMRPMRVKVYELRDTLNQVELAILTNLSGEAHTELRQSLVSHIKQAVRLLDAL